MKIRKCHSPFLASCMYIISENGRAVLIDPFPREISEQVDFVLLTHEHFDHISGVNYFKERYDCSVLCSEKAFGRLESPRDNMSRYFDVFTDMPQFKGYPKVHVDEYSCKADGVLQDGEEIIWQGHKIKMIESPGHTAGCASYLLDNETLFSGDNLFKKRETSTRFPTGSQKDYDEITIPKFKELDGEVIVLPGHYEKFYLKDKKF